MASQRYGVFACRTCGVMTMIPDVDVTKQHQGLDPDELGDKEPLSRCAIVRETDGDDHDVCTGDDVFRGFIEVTL